MLGLLIVKCEKFAVEEVVEFLKTPVPEIFCAVVTVKALLVPKTKPEVAADP